MNQRSEDNGTGTHGMSEANGAGEGNRTLVVSLGSCCSTIELHPLAFGAFDPCASVIANEPLDGCIGYNSVAGQCGFPANTADGPHPSKSHHITDLAGTRIYAALTSVRTVPITRFELQQV